ncbi:MAG: PH domain-containing protein [Nitrospira sp.]|nr:PH domain-containing protein [Nitrospira sp.]
MKESILWADYPSWRQFSWLYLMAGLVAGRAWLFWRFGFSGWIDWTVGAIVLLGTAAILRHWAHYEISLARLAVRNGYTDHEINAVELSAIDRTEIRQGAIASLLGIGTVVALSNGKPALRFRGVNDPEGVKRRIDTAIRMPVHDRMSQL